MNPPSPVTRERNKGTSLPLTDKGSLVTGSLGSLGSLVTDGSGFLLDDGAINRLELEWGVGTDGYFTCPLPGHSGRSHLHHEDGIWWLACCKGRLRSLAEVRANRAYGIDWPPRKNIELATWWRRLAYDLGCFHPVDVPVPALPEDATPELHRVRNGFALLVGLRYADHEPRPVAFSVRFAAAWCERRTSHGGSSAEAATRGRCDPQGKRVRPRLALRTGRGKVRGESMSLQAEKALAAARTRLLAERLGPVAGDVLIAEWDDMLDDMEDARSAGAAELILLDYRQGIEARLASRTLHAPLPSKGAP